MATLYQFESEDGVIIEKLFAFGCAPKIGEIEMMDGVAYKRIFCGHVAAAQIARVTHQYPFTSESLPRNFDFGCKRDGKGRQVINSQKQESEVLARASAYSEGIGETKWERD